jgi:hypothetical protein
MKKLLLLAVAGLLALGSPSHAAGKPPANMTASSPIIGSQLLWCPIGLSADYKCTFTQVAAYINSLVSGDCTATGTGTLTCTGPTHLSGTAASLTAGHVTTNANLTGAITSSGNATSLGSFSSANLLAALTTSTGTGSAVFGTAPTISSLNATTAMTLAFLTGGGTQCLTVGNAGGVGAQACTSGGTVTSVSAGCGLSTGGSAITTTGTVSANVTATNNTGTTDTITSTACGTLVTENNASSVAVAITTAGFSSGNYFTVKNFGAGVATYTPSSGTIDGAATLVCKQNQSADIYFDSTNFKTLGNTCGQLQLIANGTATIPNTLIASQACGTAIAVSNTGIIAGDIATAGFASDPTGTTGFLPTAMLTIVPYITAGTGFGFRPCNLTGSSITPVSFTFEYKVIR